MRILSALLVLCVAGQLSAATRYLTGIGIPTTETPGGALVVGTIDWGTPEQLTTADYDLTLDGDPFAGQLILTASTNAGAASQLVFADVNNGIVVTAISADGPTTLDAAAYVNTEGYGGYEAWTLTDTAAGLNRYASLTQISATPIAVPEPGAWVMLLIGVGTGMLMIHNRA